MDNKNMDNTNKKNTRTISRYDNIMNIILTILMGVGLLIISNAFIIQPTIESYKDMFEMIEQHKTKLRLKELRKDMCSIYNTDESKRCKDAEERLAR